MIYFEQLFSELQKHISGKWQAYYIIIYSQKNKSLNLNTTKNEYSIAKLNKLYYIISNYSDIHL